MSVLITLSFPSISKVHTIKNMSCLICIQLPSKRELSVNLRRCLTLLHGSCNRPHLLLVLELRSISLDELLE